MKRYKHNKPNGYPPKDRTVLYSRKKNMKPIPEVGKYYHCYDDGKITPSRHYVIKVDEVLGYMQFKKKYPESFKEYVDAAKECYWLYSRRSDKFIITDKGENDEFGVFVRTKQGGWFSIGGWFNSGRLDITGELTDNLISYIDMFNYTAEEKQNIIKELTEFPEE